MFIDEFSINAQAGRGGDGSVHFARRKYQPFGGPDGGDGGAGGDVVLLGKRDCDSLDHLRTLKTRAAGGGAGGGNQVFGARGADCDLPVPLGTLAYNKLTGAEIGTVLRGSQRYVLAQGGKGGVGNPHYATGRRRAPKIAGSGKPGDQIEALLRYRIYCHVALIEPLIPGSAMLLPRLLSRDADAVDYDLYRRKPRWLRVERDFARYDVAYLPLDIDEEGAVVSQQLAHLYWAQHAVVNLLPLGGGCAPAWQALVKLIGELPLRRLQQLTVVGASRAGEDATLPTEAGLARVVMREAREPDDTLACFETQLTGGTVD